MATVYCTKRPPPLNLRILAPGPTTAVHHLTGGKPGVTVKIYLDPVDIFPLPLAGSVLVHPLLAVSLQVLILLRLLWPHRNAGDVEVCPVGIVQ